MLASLRMQAYFLEKQGMADEPSPQEKGGMARAESLPAKARSEIARKAARSRWDLPLATHEGTLHIGTADIPCYVLENGERILSTRGVMLALKRRWRGRKYSGTELPVFLEAKNLKPFIDNDLTSVLSVINFRSKRGNCAEGFKAQIVPSVCEVYLRARDEGDVLTVPQARIARQCEILMRGLAHVGILALVDEATGYQEVRDRMALQAILEQYLRKELAVWAKRFPDDFYQEIFRLRGWQWKGMKVNRPQVVANYTNDFVWERLAPGILKELEARNPVTESGYRKAKHHQWLTDEIGHPQLAQHLYAIVGLMRAAGSWEQFKAMINKAFPKKGMTLSLPLTDGHGPNGA